MPQPRIHELFSEAAVKSEIAFGFNKMIFYVSNFETSRLEQQNG